MAVRQAIMGLGPPRFNSEVIMSRQSDLDNHANQLNPNNDAYWESRGLDERPDHWEERPAEDDKVPEQDSPIREQAKQ